MALYLSDDHRHRRLVRVRKLKEVLLVAAKTGVLLSAVAAPGASPLLDKIFPLADEIKRKKELRRLVSTMKYQKLVTVTDMKNGDYKIKITGAGKKRVKLLSLLGLEIVRPEKWDKQWRLVVFDIPKVHSKTRGRFRYWLKELGFVKVQYSIWAHPYPCFVEIEFLKAYFNIRDMVTVITAAEMDPDTVGYLKKHFLARGLI